MNTCIIKIEVNECYKSGCGGPSWTHIGVFKNKKQAKSFMTKDKHFKKCFNKREYKKTIEPISIWLYGE